MAPEQFSPAKYGINGKIGTNLDLWSFGLMVYELNTGTSLFGSRGGQSSAEQVMSNILNDELNDVKIKKLPGHYQTLVAKCLVKDANGMVQKAEEPTTILNNGISLPIAYDITKTKVINKVIIAEKPTEKETEKVTQIQNNITSKSEPEKKRNMLPWTIRLALVVIGFVAYFLSRPTHTLVSSNFSKPNADLKKKGFDQTLNN